MTQLSQPGSLQSLAARMGRDSRPQGSGANKNEQKASTFDSLWKALDHVHASAMAGSSMSAKVLGAQQSIAIKNQKLPVQTPPPPRRGAAHAQQHKAARRKANAPKNTGMAIGRPRLRDRYAAGTFVNGRPTVSGRVASMMDSAEGNPELLAAHGASVRRAHALLKKGYLNSGMVNVLVGPEQEGASKAFQSLSTSMNAEQIESRFVKPGTTKAAQDMISHELAGTSKKPFDYCSQAGLGGSWGAATTPTGVGSAAGGDPARQRGVKRIREQNERVLVPDEPTAFHRMQPHEGVNELEGTSRTMIPRTGGRKSLRDCVRKNKKRRRCEDSSSSSESDD